MKPSAYRWLFCSLALVGFAVDQGSKYGVFHALYRGAEEGEIDLLPGIFKLWVKYSSQRDPGDLPLSWLRVIGDAPLPQVNHGALFGLASEHGYDANLFFTVVSLAAGLAIIVWITRTSAARDAFLTVALGLILAGTMGNLFDRLVFGGVRDFLYFYLINWPVFNVADCCLVCGAGLLLLQAFFAPSPLPEPATQTAAGTLAQQPDAQQPDVVQMK